MSNIVSALRETANLVEAQVQVSGPYGEEMTTPGPGS